MSRIKILLVLFVSMAQVSLASATITYAVGACKPSLPSFTTINGALAATPPPNVVKVCPGTYREEVGIYIPVTLEGVSSGNSEQAIIAVPSGGLFIDGGDDLGDFVAAQVLVKNVTGQVNLTNLTIDGTGNNVTSSATYIVGVFYQNSSGMVSRLTIQNQNGNRQSGVAVWLEGGSALPSVITENNNLQNFDHAGIYAETNFAGSELTATVKGNALAADTSTSNLPTGITPVGGLTATVSGNLITGGEGVVIYGGNGSVTGNKIVNSPVGIDIENDGVSVTGNTIYNTAVSGNGTGIIADSAVAPVTGNTIVQSPFGIVFDCYAGNNVHSNTILDSAVGLFEVPTPAVTTNTYYNVGTMRIGGC